VTHTISQPPLPPPTLTPTASCGPSSLEAQPFSPYVWDTLEVLHLEHKDEPHERDDPRAEGGRDGRPHNCMALL
jgi:hypothetical protein